MIRYRKDALAGILNGIDTDEWNPGTDPHLSSNYNRRTLGNKAKNKLALQEQLGLEVTAELPLFGFVGRLVDQKGVDLILEQMNQFLELNCQLVVLGSGFPHYETALTAIASQHPGKVAVTLGYNESLAHRIEASCDIFLMPSLFEPCGLNQMYSLRYGTLPIVHAVGGLRDTVFEHSQDNETKQANGFVFNEATAAALFAAIQRALNLFEKKAQWKQLQSNAMGKDFSWNVSANEYSAIYEKIING